MATDIIARGMITEYKSGTNINFAENDDGSVTISASGSVSSEDSVARDTINNHKLDKNNPHNVTAEQIGLGNVDNTSDLDKPISTAVQQAIDNKADKTVATTSADGLMSAEDKSKLDDVDNTYALKSKYGDTTIDVGRKSGTTVGKHSTAEGYSSTASGDYSHAEGAVTTASGNRSHAEGYLCTASSDNSHAEGNNTTASGAHSHAEGSTTTASGVGSHSGGTSSTASGDYSFAHGMYVESNNSSEVSLGKFNKSSSDTLFSIGDGTSKTARHNAFEITTTGGKLHDKDIATTGNISNPNLLINPDFKINQRGETDFSVTYHQGTPISQSQKYTVDRWRIMDGEANISNGKFTLTGTIIQVLENSIGSDFTATVTVESGTATASYDDSTKTFSIVGNNAVLNWAKLEYGSNATQFIPPDTATELLKCQRYFYKCICNNIQGSIPSTCFNGCVRATVHLPTCMRTTPSLKIISAGYVYNDSGYISLENSGLFVYGMVGNYLAIKSANIVSIDKDCVATTSDCDFEFDAEIY